MKENKNITTLTNEEELFKFHVGNISLDFPFKHLSENFHINRIEEVLSVMQFPIPPHRKKVIDLFIVRKGHSERTKGLVKYRVNERQIFVLPPFQITEHHSISEDIEGFYLHFSPELFEKYKQDFALNKFEILDFFINPVIDFNEESFNRINVLCEHLMTIYHSNSFDEEEAVYYILIILKEISKQKIQKIPVKTMAHQIVQTYLELLSKHIYEINKVTEFAEKLNITPNHLNKCCKQILGISAQEKLNEMLILEIKTLINYSNLSLAEIGEKLLKQNPSNFSRFFKNNTGLTPFQYKKNLEL